MRYAQYIVSNLEEKMQITNLYEIYVVNWMSNVKKRFFVKNLQYQIYEHLL
jgi:hypothetical protein